MRRTTALLGAAALVAATLAGCTAAPFGGCTPAYVSGDSSTLVTAKGAIASKPTVTFPTPLVAGAKPEATVMTAGEGAVVPSGAQVDYDFTLLDGKSGEVLGASGYDGTQFTRLGTGLAGDSVSKALSCATVGSRVAVVSTWKQAKAAFSSDASGSLDDKTTVVVVIDILQSYLGKADGFNQLPKDGLPAVATAVDGTPGITVLAKTAPKTTQIGLIKGGDGATLKADDKAVVQYALWTWPATVGDEPAQIGTTWTDHRAVTLALTSITDGGGVPDGLLKALIGARVGSQVLVVLPPGDDSFPTGQGPASDDSTYIFVVDVLGIQKDAAK